MRKVMLVAAPDIRRKVGLRIKELRAERGMSQESLAYAIGMARTYLAEVEAGKRNISVINLERIATGLGVTLGEFFHASSFEDK
jgi:transcriptional regulator with XRE-family HTH domain